jgi:hypothetical protein
MLAKVAGSSGYALTTRSFMIELIHIRFIGEAPESDCKFFSQCLCRLELGNSLP